MTLSGWHKAWIVISLISAMPVAITTWLKLPSPEPIKAAWADAALVVVKGYDDRGWPSVDALREALYRGLDYDAIIRRVGKDVRRLHGDKIKKGVSATSMLLDIAIVDDYYTRQLAALRAQQVYCVARGGTVWLVLVVLTYGAAFFSSLCKRSLQK